MNDFKLLLHARMRGYKLAAEFKHGCCDSTDRARVAYWLVRVCMSGAPTATADATAEFQSRGLALNKFLTYMHNCASRAR